MYMEPLVFFDFVLLGFLHLNRLEVYEDLMILHVWFQLVSILNYSLCVFLIDFEMEILDGEANDALKDDEKESNGYVV